MGIDGMNPKAKRLPQESEPSDGIGLSLGQQVRAHVLEKIDSGEWREGDRIPSESQLAEQFDASRMTIHIALRDLAVEGVLVRRQGAGTFVAARRRQSTFLELRNINSEIEERGNRHTTDVISLERVHCDMGLATEMNVAPGSELYHSVLLHRENGRPLQIEDRFVNPRFSPDFLEQDYTQITPHQHLMATGPLEEVEHIIQAVPADERCRELLVMASSDPVLLLRRRTWSRGMVATSARIYHPGSRFSMAGRMVVAR